MLSLTCELTCVSIIVMAWLVYESETLNMKYAVNAETGIVRTEDGVQYSRAETELLTSQGDEITPGLHLVKKLFSGVIVGSEEKDA